MATNQTSPTKESINLDDHGHINVIGEVPEVQAETIPSGTNGGDDDGNGTPVISETMAEMIMIQNAIGYTTEEIVAQLDPESATPITMGIENPTSSNNTNTNTNINTDRGFDGGNVGTFDGIEYGTGQNNYNVDEKLGGKYLTCCCDYRRATLLSGIVFPITLVASLYGQYIYSSEETGLYYNSHQFNSFMEQFYVRRIVFTGVATGTAIGTAIAATMSSMTSIDRAWPLGLHLLAMTVSFITYFTHFAQLERAVEGIETNDDYYSLYSNDVIVFGPPLNYFLVTVFYASMFYPNIFYALEIYRGIWSTPENMVRENYCCC